MTLFKALNVQQRMTAIIFLVSLFVLFVVSTQFFLLELRQMRRVAREDLSLLVQVLSANARRPMALKDHISMQEILDSLEARNDVVSAYLLDVEGHSIVRYPNAQNKSSKIDVSEDITLLEMESRQIKEA